MPTNHWTKLESPWIPKIRQNFQPQLRSYPRKQRPSQVSPLCIYFTIIFWANIWNNQKLTSENFPKKYPSEMHLFRSSKIPAPSESTACDPKTGERPSTCCQAYTSWRGGAEPSVHPPSSSNLRGWNCWNPWRNHTKNPSCFLPKIKSKVNKTSFTKFPTYTSYEIISTAEQKSNFHKLLAKNCRTELFRNVLFLNPHHNPTTPAPGTWNWKDHGDFDGKGCQPWIQQQGWRYRKNGWFINGIKPPYFFIDDFFWGYCTPIFEKHPYIPKMFFFFLVFLFFFFEKTIFFWSPCHKREFENRSWFSKGFLIVSDGFCSKQKHFPIWNQTHWKINMESENQTNEKEDHLPSTFMALGSSP